MGSVHNMGIIKLSVKEYMSSLHKYMETPLTAKCNGDGTSTTCTPKSISEMLKLCEADPVELLLDLGFGIEEPDICNKIPSRFIMTPSEARGITTRVFLDAQKRRMELENPNLCGRFRQLEVLEQVTSAFSSLLDNVHAIQNDKDKDIQKSTLTKEKRNRIRQLIWKFSKQVKNVDRIPSTCKNTDEPIGKQGQQEPLKTIPNGKVFRKKRSNKNNSVKDASPASDNGSIFPARQESQQSMLPTPVTQYNLPEMPGKIRTMKSCKMLSRTLRKSSSQNTLQPPDSFEMEEVLSFEEDYPKVLSHDRFLEKTRSSSCQSDSSGFLEEPLELTQNRHGSSDSIDSQVTLHGKSNSSDFQDILEENNRLYDFASPLVAENALVMTSHCLDKNKYKSISMNTENSEDVFQSFDSNMKEMDQQVSISEDTENAMEEFSDGLYCVQEDELGNQTDNQANTQDTPEYEYPVYITHYSNDMSKNNNETTSTKHENLTDYFEGQVSDLQNKGYSVQKSLSVDDCSVEMSGLRRSLTPTSTPQSLNFMTETPYKSADYSNVELNHTFQNKKSTFQTEIKSNIYKSVTIQMPSSFPRGSADGTSRQHSVYNTIDRNPGQGRLTCVEDRMDAFSQTETGWWNGSFTNNHSSRQRSTFLTDSHSFEMGLCDHQHSLPPPLNISCCHCCHHHHCCMLRCQTIRQNITSSPSSANIRIERELSDTLHLLRESLFNISLKREHDMENMKRVCHRYREKLLEIEQLLQEQQAHCFSILTREEKENMRRLHTLRRNVFKEATKLECNLEERAQHVRESISLQLEEVLDEQSRLYSELDFCNLRQDCTEIENSDTPDKIQNAPSTSSVPKEDSETITNLTEENKQLKKTEPSPKHDFSTIIQNIKKAFRSFNNS